MNASLLRANVLLDTLRPDRFQAVTRRDGLGRALASLSVLKDAGMEPVEVNAVVLRGVSDDEAPELLESCLESGYQLRFIEQVPLDADLKWDRKQMITAAEILDMLSTRFDLQAIGARWSSPAEKFDVDHGRGTVGVIASVSQPFCRACDRKRLTADGQVGSCLFNQEETDLRAMIRAGADDADLAVAWAKTMVVKLPGHSVGSADVLQPGPVLSVGEG